MSPTQEQYSPPKPARFIRITDNTSFIQYGCYGTSPAKHPVGFDVGYSTRCIPLTHRITAASVAAHLNWSTTCEWKGLISVCDSIEKAQREIEWRQRKGRWNIAAYEISTTELHWSILDLETCKLQVLRNESGYSQEVVFIHATELLLKLGANEMVNERARGGARYEWIALEWIPSEMVKRVEVDSLL